MVPHSFTAFKTRHIGYFSLAIATTKILVSSFNSVVKQNFVALFSLNLASPKFLDLEIILIIIIIIIIIIVIIIIAKIDSRKI